MKKLIVIADWAHGSSLENTEVACAVKGFLKEPATASITFVTSTPSTIHTAFLMSQVVVTEEYYGQPIETVVFQNTDARWHAQSHLEKADGAKPLIIRLKSGVYVVGPNAQYNFSLIKNKIEEVYEYTGINEEGQFHSRDLYARIAAHLMDYMEDEMDLEEISSNIIPALEGYHVGHIDGYGNMKTTIHHEYFKEKYKYGDVVKIKINEVQHNVKYVTNLFGGEKGELVIYPGSSGPKDNRYLEITRWSHFTGKDAGTGLHAFNNPIPGQEIIFV